MIWASIFVLVSLALGFFRFSSQIRLWSRSTAQFRPSAEDSRVWFEPGAEENTRLIAQALPQAIQGVEQKLGRPFVAPPKVYVCASLPSFDSYGGRGRSGFVFARRLFISPKPANTPARLPELLAHELVHLHVQQRRNLLVRLFTPPDPAWFTEGLAVHATDRGSLELARESEAWQAIATGRHFRSMENERLGQAMGYRQSGMFVNFLQQLDSVKFKAFLFAAEDGRKVEPALEAAFGESVDSLWSKFLTEARKRTAS